jgi:amino acid transporter
MSTNHINKIGLATATIVGMNAMIGAGIFSAPEAIARSVGPAGILTYVFVVFAVLFMALSFARLAQLFPKEGSFYTYASQWGGRTAGLIASGAYFTGLVFAMGLLSRIAGLSLAPFASNFASDFLSSVILISLVILNMFGVALSELGQHILIVCTTFPIIATIIACFCAGKMSNLTPFAPFGFAHILDATRVAIFGFFGFESAASLFNVVENPSKNVPRAVTYSIIIVGILYTLFIGSLIFAVPLNYFVPGIQLPDILKTQFPNSPWFIFSIRISILSAILGTIHSMIWGSASLLVFLVKKVNPAWKLSNAVAVATVGFLIFVTFNVLKNIDLFFYITSTCIITAFLMSIATLLTMKSEWRSGNNIKTILGMTTAGAILCFALQGIVQELMKVVG